MSDAKALKANIFNQLPIFIKVWLKPIKLNFFLTDTTLFHLFN